MEVILMVIAIMCVLLVMVCVYYDKSNKNLEKISFREAFNLVDLPIIILYNNGNKYNFLLDTGSTDSHINKAVIDSGNIMYTESEQSKSVYGMEGNLVEVKTANITFSLDRKEFSDIFLINDLGAAFDNIKKENGVTLHGILGTSFFNKYRYVIDFNKYIAYSEK